MSETDPASHGGCDAKATQPTIQCCLLTRINKTDLVLSLSLPPSVNNLLNWTAQHRSFLLINKEIYSKGNVSLKSVVHIHAETEKRDFHP